VEGREIRRDKEGEREYVGERERERERERESICGRERGFQVGKRLNANEREGVSRHTHAHTHTLHLKISRINCAETFIEHIVVGDIQMTEFVTYGALVVGAIQMTY